MRQAARRADKGMDEPDEMTRGRKAAGGPETSGSMRMNEVVFYCAQAGRDRTDTPTLLSLELLSYEPPRRDAARSALPAFCSTAAKTAAKSASNMSVTLLPSLAEVSK